MTDNKSGHGIGSASAWAVAVCPVLLTAGMVVLLTTDATRAFAMRISRENSVIELVTAGLMLLGGVCGFGLALKARALGLPAVAWGFVLLFSFGMCVVGMEEIAWGQMLFAYQTPEMLLNLNQQQEMTLHNLPGLHGHSDMMWSAFALAGLIGIALRKRPVLALIAPAPVLAPWFLIVLVIGVTLTYRDMTDGDNRLFTLARRIDEFAEMLIAMASCLYLWFCARRLNGPA